MREQLPLHIYLSAASIFDKTVAFFKTWCQRVQVFVDFIDMVGLSLIFINPSPSSTAFAELDIGGRSLNREAQTSLFPATQSGSSEVLPHQLGDIVLPPGPGPSVVLPSGGMCLENLIRRPSNQMSKQPHLALLHLAPCFSAS